MWERGATGPGDSARARKPKAPGLSPVLRGNRRTRAGGSEGFRRRAAGLSCHPAVEAGLGEASPLQERNREILSSRDGVMEQVMRTCVLRSRQKAETWEGARFRLPVSTAHMPLGWRVWGSLPGAGPSGPHLYWVRVYCPPPGSVFLGQHPGTEVG